MDKEAFWTESLDLDEHPARPAASCQCVACLADGPHLSSCAVHNEPAEPIGQCSCGRLPLAALLRPDIPLHEQERRRVQQEGPGATSLRLAGGGSVFQRPGDPDVLTKRRMSDGSEVHYFIGPVRGNFEEAQQDMAAWAKAKAAEARGAAAERERLRKDLLEAALLIDPIPRQPVIDAINRICSEAP